eukprot:1431412-Pyramimonas_sp.AAC.1
MTGARINKGKNAYAIEDMRDACEILETSIRTGQDGRKKWRLTAGRLDRSTRQARGLVTIALPRGDGTRERVTQRKLAALAYVRPAL